MNKFIFVGNRRFVIDLMREMKLNIIKIFSIKGSHLERQLNEELIPNESVGSKAELIEKLFSLDFDVMILNGCPFILPIEGYKNKYAKLINIHPSYLPELRGCDPVPGSLLFKKDSGATCHFIDEGIDTGPIISQVKIPYSDSLDAQLLYQLSFLAEKECFYNAYINGFKIKSLKEKLPIKDSYFTATKEDQIIDFSCKNNDLLLRKSKAFSNSSRGLTFRKGDLSFRVFSISIVSNPYLEKLSTKKINGDIILIFEDSLIIKLNDELLRFDSLLGEISKLRQGDNLIKINT